MGKNFLKRDQIYQLISFIPSLDCYNKKQQARKPLDAIAFELLTKVAYEGAFRIDEAINIKVKDIDFKFEEIELPNTKTGRKWCECAKTEMVGHTRKRKLISCDPKCLKCKGVGKIRTKQHGWIPKFLMKELEEFILKRKLSKGQYLFESPSFLGQSISYEWVWKTYKELGFKSGFEILARYKVRKTVGMYSHFLRKCKAKQMYFIDGFTLTEVAKKLRHAGDLRSLLAYIEADEEDLRQKERAIYG